MIDPRGEGPGALLPAFARRAELLERLVAATIRQEKPEAVVARLFTVAHGATAPDSNHWLTSTRINTTGILITPGGSGAAWGRLQLRVGSALFFSFSLRNYGETMWYPLRFVIAEGQEVWDVLGQVSASDECWVHLQGYPL